MNDPVKELAERLLGAGFDTLPERDQRVLTRIAERAHISRDVHADFDTSLSFGDNLADQVAKFGGSWAFISIFAILLVAWVVTNTVVLIDRAFDPYPFIFLNLILSMLAAIQAPVIMMSQNRQSAKDRLAATHDYEVNLKAELEIMGLHEKLDQLRTQQLTELLQTQQQQIAMLTALVEGKREG